MQRWRNKNIDSGRDMSQPWNPMRVVSSHEACAWMPWTMPWQLYEVGQTFSPLTIFIISDEGVPVWTLAH